LGGSKVMQVDSNYDSARTHIFSPSFPAIAGLTAALLGVLCFVLWPKSVPMSNVRVANSSSQTLHSVLVGKGRYGDLAPGQVSAYLTWGPAYAHERISFDVNGKHLLQQPEDHYSEYPLGQGAFTYVIGVNDDSLSSFSAVLHKDAQ
jgi:hypothetical protein